MRPFLFCLGPLCWLNFEALNYLCCSNRWRNASITSHKSLFHLYLCCLL